MDFCYEVEQKTFDPAERKIEEVDVCMNEIDQKDADANQYESSNGVLTAIRKKFKEVKKVPKIKTTKISKIMRSCSNKGV